MAKRNQLYRLLTKSLKRQFICRLLLFWCLVFTFAVITCLVVWINDTTLKRQVADIQIRNERFLNRLVDDIQIHVIGWSRPDSMDTLLRQLEDADYNNWHHDVTLYIHLDGRSTKEKEINNVAARLDWTHGQKIIKKQKENIGLRKMWLDSIGAAARAAGDNTLLVVFEDDIRVSPAYFKWLLAMINQYAWKRDPNLVGFSLSPMPFMRWDAGEAMGKRRNATTYLTTVPSSWGAAYWSNHWNDFDDFVRLRMQSPFYDIAAENEKNITDYAQFRMSPKELHVPDARANVWPNSWKRFMIDFMCARGLVMMYPNLPGKKGLATTLQMSGQHQRINSIDEPQVAVLLDHLDPHVMNNLPQYGDLDVFGLNLLLSTHEKLMLEGSKFLHGVREKWHSLTLPDQLLDDLVQRWAPPGFDFAREYCVADLYASMSTASSSGSVPSTSEERYLLFEPQYGTNNQLSAVITAYYWARALGRRLILPPLMIPRVSDTVHGDSNATWLELENFFHISDADKDDLFASSSASFNLPALEPISFTEFLTLDKKPWRLLKATRDAVFDKSARLLTSALHKKDIELVDIQHHMSNTLKVRTLQRYLGGCNDEVLAFDGLFFANLADADPSKLMPDVMQPSKKVTKIYDTVKASFLSAIGSSEYACYHVRLDDFVSMCNKVENPEKHPEVSSWFVNTAKDFKCVVTPEELAFTIEEKGYPALVMSDNPSELKETLNTLTLKTLTSDWVKQTVEALLPEASFSEIQLLSLIIDQALCSDAKIALLNKFSTVSKRVVSLRRGKDSEYWKKDRNKKLSKK